MDPRKSAIMVKMMAKTGMMRRLGGAFLILFAIFLLPSGLAEWQKPVQPSFSGGDLTCLIPHPLDASKVLVASERQIFESDRANAWHELWSQSDIRFPISRLFTFPVLPGHVFAMTPGKIIMGDLKNRSWRTIYQDSGKPPLSFAVHPEDPNRWFLGTEKGLYETPDAGRTWAPSKLLPSSGPILLLYFEGQRLFIADPHALHLAASGAPARSVFEAPQPPEVAWDENSEPSVEDEKNFFAPAIHDLISTQSGGQRLFLATRNGAFQSTDGGFSWTPLSQSGLESREILQLAYSEKEARLYAATPRGVYGYDARAERWTELFQGLAKDRAQSIAILDNKKLTAITADGFVQYPLTGFRPEGSAPVTIGLPPQETLSLFRKLVSSEPSAREVQKKVIRYADVGNGKIKRWHAGSRIAAALPAFSVGKNFDRSASVTTYSGKYITGPDDVSRGWDADVGWDLGDMIYSSDQTSIDSREKMMVELRNDFLSEVTRIYYERRRLQIDIVFTPSASEQEHLERLLRMDELTSLLDGMTDGFFSKQLDVIYTENPRLSRLWEFKPTDGGCRMKDDEKTTTNQETVYGQPTV